MSMTDNKRKLQQLFENRIIFKNVTKDKKDPAACFISVNTFNFNRETVKQISQNTHGLIKYIESLYELNNKYFNTVSISGKETLSLDYFDIINYTEEGVFIEQDDLYTEPFNVFIITQYNNYSSKPKFYSCKFCKDFPPRIYINHGASESPENPHKQSNCLFCQKQISIIY